MHTETGGTSTMRGFKEKAFTAVFDRYMRWRLPDLMRPEYPVVLDYGIHPESRYGEGKPPHPELAALFSTREEAFLSTLSALSEHRESLLRVLEKEENPAEPCWDNAWFSSLDSIALYGLLASRKPSLYVEIGSGYSTKFARRAVRDSGARTQIISIDPVPRAEIDTVCDRVIRQPLEDTEMGLFNQLQPGDFLFLDSSHRVFQNSDVTVFFMEILPRLKSGVVVHVHDIFLPLDYPNAWRDRHYSEQYLLAAYLLAGSDKFEVLLPGAYIGWNPRTQASLDELWREPVFQRAFARYRQLTGGYVGTSFWFTVK